MRSLFTAAALAALSVSLFSDDSDRLLTIDHFVRVKSTVPATQGQSAVLYVRERVKASTIARGGSLADRVVLFVHGAGTPAEVAFDVPFEDYSWMAYIADAGFDVFSVDMSGYGRSTRPPQMNDPCNVAQARQIERLVPSLLPAPCPPSYAKQMTTMGPTGAISMRPSTMCGRCGASIASASPAGRKAVRAPAAIPHAIPRR